MKDTYDLTWQRESGGHQYLEALGFYHLEIVKLCDPSMVAIWGHR